METEQDVSEDIEKTSEDADLNTEDESTEEVDSQEESVEQLKERLEKAEKVAESQRIRAEKAERKAKQVKEPAPKEEQPKESSQLSQVDLIALIKADVTETEDIAEVTDYAKLKGISVAKALKTNVVKSILAEKSENRKVADATNTGPSKRGSGKVSDETLLSKARDKGELPDSPEDLDRLISARLGLKK